jgi:tripartite-type tricarboxylate transporter receptor subunit TctC
MLQRIVRSVVCILAVFWAAAAGAQQYPDKVITMIVPFAAGGPSDTIARILAQTMSASLKQQIIIENVGGAGGTIGAARVAQSAPDGYTLFVHHIGHSTAPALYRKLTYDPIADFQPIGIINDGASTFVSRKDLAAKNFKEYLDYVKTNKDKVNMANAGIGSASHLCGLLFQDAIQTEVTPVPYKGTGPAMNDLLGGMVDIMCDQSTNTTPHIKAGKINVYAVTLPKRLASMPDVPTADEAGLPNFTMSVWHALYVPKGTPQPIVDTLVKSLQNALQDANLKQRYAELGAEAVSLERATPEALATHLKSEIDRWGPIIKKAGVYAN